MIQSEEMNLVMEEMELLTGPAGTETPMWVAVGDDTGGNGSIMYSYDGISWSDSVRGDAFATDGNGITYGMSLFGRFTQITEKAYPAR